MASSKFQSPPSASASSVWSRYDVVLSFRGADTSRHFVNCLLTSLSNAGISVFRDEKDAEADKQIDHALVEAIGQSKISIPIISPEYSSSKSCLKGLAKLLECRDTMNHAIIPIFYGVDPSDIGSFASHKKRRIDGKLLDSGKSALQRIGQLKGYHLDPTSDQDGRLISELVLYVTRQLKNAELVGTSMPVGIDNQVRRMMANLEVDYPNGQAVAIRGNEVRMVGIHGAAGIGKTTLATFIYSQLYPLFEGCSYLGNIGEVLKTEPLEHLQSQLLSDLLKQEPISLGSVEEGIDHIKRRFRGKRVLIVLDDVHERDQLEAFAGKLSWFGSRSRIIVTTRNAGLVKILGMSATYEVKPMDFDQSLCLFHRHALGESTPREDYDDLSKQIVSEIGGIPLVIEVLGSFLYRKKKEAWEGMLHQLKKIPTDMVRQVLMTSYDGLDQGTKAIFLDIACFFIGKDKRIPFYMWEDCGFCPDRGLESLLLTSLVKIGENNELSVYDLLRDLGLAIVRDEDRAFPGRRSRLWNHEDALGTLRRKEGTERVKALCLKYDIVSQDYFTREEFQGLSELTFLKLDSANIRGDFTNLLPKLRWLDWRGCPATFEAMNLHLERLVILDLSWSKVTQDWEGWNQIKMPRLKVLNLTGCNEMWKTPDFSNYPQLEMLILERCSQLLEIHPSICDLTFLVSLNLKSCSNLCELPSELGNMKALKELLIDGTSIQEIPESISRMKKLETLSASSCDSLAYLPDGIYFPEALSMLLLDNARILELPDSIGSLVKLKRLSLRDCREIRELPESIGNLGCSLVELDVSGTLIVELPNSTSNLQLLRVLKMERCHVRKFPSAIGELRKLEEIHASYCRSLEGSIPHNIENLQLLKILILGHTGVSSLPPSIESLGCLQTLDLLACDNIEELPTLSSSLTCLRISSKKMRKIPDIRNLLELEDLSLGYEKPKDLIYELEDLSLGYEKPKDLIYPASSQSWTISLPKLRSLELSDSQISNLGFEYGLGCDPQLNKFVLVGANLQGLSGLPSSLSILSIQASKSLTRLPTLQNLIYLSELELLNLAVPEIVGLGELKSLEILVVSNCPIEHLDGLSELKSLMRLSLENCESLNKLPNMSDLIMLRVLKIHKCQKIRKIKGLDESTFLEELIVTECKAASSDEVKRAQRRIGKLLKTSQ